MPNVLNYFKQAGPGKDNALVLGGSVLTANGQNANVKFITIPIGDISSAGTLYVSPGVSAAIFRITCSIDAAITSADATIGFKIGANDITGSTLTVVQSGSAPGDVFFSAPTGANIISPTDSIVITRNGESSTTSNGVLVFMLQMT